MFVIVSEVMHFWFVLDGAREVPESSLALFLFPKDAESS
jgi:hypothetical protein